MSRAEQKTMPAPKSTASERRTVDPSTALLLAALGLGLDALRAPRALSLLGERP